MSNTYRSLTVVGESVWGPGEFEADLSAAEEADALGAGHLEIVPRRYRVLSNNYTGGAQGDIIGAALLVEVEAALVSGGHLERVDEEGINAGESGGSRRGRARAGGAAAAGSG